MRVDVWELEWPDRVIDKVAREHRLTVAEVEQAFIEDPNREAQWTSQSFEEHGRRLEIVGSSWGGKIIKGYLDPVDMESGLWRIRTAWKIGP